MVVSDREKMLSEVYEPAHTGELAVIVVAGVTSGAGKTSLAETVVKILSAHFPTAAAKITVTHGERGCPHGGKGCDVCGSLGGNFQVITRESIIKQSGTDTARLAQAGASRVLWTITREEFVGDAWQEMKALVSGARCLVVESNTLALTIEPSLTLMVVDPTVSRRLWKPSAEQLITEADFLIFNNRGPDEKRQALLEEVKRLRSTALDLLFVSHPHEIESHTILTDRLKQVCSQLPTAVADR